MGCAREVSILTDDIPPLATLVPDEGLSSELFGCWEESSSLMEGRGFFGFVEGSESLSLSFRFPDELDVVPLSGAFPLRALVI